MAIEKYFSLQGQCALVTGGGNGIGKAICLMFAEFGADIACTDLNLDDAELVAGECRKLGVRGIAAKCDVTNEEDRKRVVELALSQFGKLSILVNNAGGGGPKPLICHVRL